MVDEHEQWLPIPLDDRYEISSLGRVRSWAVNWKPQRRAAAPRILIPIRVGKKGGQRLAVTIRRRTYRIHVLVAAAFLGPRPDGSEIDHVNGDPYDNTAHNLEFVTRGENVRRAVALGRMSRNPRKYGNDVRAAIVASPLSSRKLSAQIGVSPSRISVIRSQERCRAHCESTAALT